MGLAASESAIHAPFYRSRNVRATPLYQLLERYYEDVKGVWEERFEKKYGFWRAFVDSVVARYLDCGIPETGFARLKCQACGAEKLLTLSCKQRGVCPSCDAKRAAAFGAFLSDEVLEDVGHSLVTFTLPKMLRGYFMRNRELLSDLARLAYETLYQLMSDAASDPKTRPGVVVVPQTFGSLLNPHPHVHCIASRGVWNEQRQWLPVPYLDLKAAEKLWAHKVLRLLQRKGLLATERIELLASFRKSGFSVDATPTVWPSDPLGIERIGRYLLRCPLSLARIHWTPGAKTLFYQGKDSHDDPFSTDPQGETLDIFEFLARVLTQIPEPRLHGPHYFGAYSSRARSLRHQQDLGLDPPSSRHARSETDEPAPNSRQRAALRKRWANLRNHGLSDRGPTPASWFSSQAPSTRLARSSPRAVSAHPFPPQASSSNRLCGPVFSVTAPVTIPYPFA
jgi:Putative transposase/Transposase zinc-binding domain